VPEARGERRGDWRDRREEGRGIATTVQRRKIEFGKN